MLKVSQISTTPPLFALLKLMMLFDLSPFIQTARSPGAAPHQDNTDMPSLLNIGESNTSSPHSPGAMPITSKRKSSSRESSRSSSIPLPSTHVSRTQSELQLCLDEEIAEQRDTLMFYRLVNGIRERQSSPTQDLDETSERSIAGIYHTRLASHVEVCEQNSSLDPDDTPKWSPLRSRVRQVSEGSSHDEWSISGFDSCQHEQPHANATMTNIALRCEEDDEDDEGVFSLDL
jgi:hypothetical protein